MAKVKYIVLLPLNYNDKSEVPKEVRKQIFDELYRLAGGYHVAGTGRGAYKMKSGKKQVDSSLEVWVVVEEKDADALKELVSGFAELLEQESIYLERVSSSVEFIPPKTAGG